MKKIITIVLALTLMAFMITACGGGNRLEWPTSALAEMLPIPESNRGRVMWDMENSLYVIVENTSREQFNAYVDECRNFGFNENYIRSDREYDAYNASGFHLTISYNDRNNEMTIHLVTPPNFDVFQWPRSEIAALLPIPESNIGSISTDRADRFSVHVGETTREQYNAYVDAVMDRGFIIDFSRSDDSFRGRNEAGFAVRLSFERNNTMWITIEAPSDTEVVVEEVEETEVDDEPVASVADNDESNNNDDVSTDTTTVSWQEFLEEYEAWVDAFIEFMERYNANPTDMTLLAEYMELMTEMIEWAEKAENLEDDLSGEDLRLYMETMTRILQKLAAITP